LRVATLRDGILKLEKHLASEGATSIRMASAYDADVFTEAANLRVNLEGSAWPSANAPDNRVMLTTEIARAMAVIALTQISVEGGWASVFCFPLVADLLKVNIRCFNPGESSVTYLETRCVRNCASCHPTLPKVLYHAMPPAAR